MKKEYFYQNELPIIEAKLLGPKKSLKIGALLDSGASTSLFQAKISDRLGISLENGEKVKLKGIGGEITGYLHEVPVLVNGIKFKCKIVFSREIAENVNLFGRDNFFIPFLITFNEKYKKFLIQENK
jgi:hypothetical protein